MISNYTNTTNFNIDQPITDADDDLFGRSKIVDKITDYISFISSQSNPCVSIGIYGKWGEGKSSVLNLIEKRFEKTENVITVRFCPWILKDQESLLLDFFQCNSKSLFWSKISIRS